MSPHLEFVLLDPLGLVLLPAHDEYPPQYGSPVPPIPPKLMRRMLLSGIWQRYERGHIPTLEEAAVALAELPFVKTSMANIDDCALAKTIATSMSHARSPYSLRELPDMAKLLDNLRDQLNLKLVCTTNATREEMCMLQSRLPTAFARFDTIIISGEEGVGKTSQQFMQVALQKAGIRHAHHCMYLDACDMQSIVAARSVGMHAALIQPHQLIARINPFARRINLEELANLEALTPLIPQPHSAPQVGAVNTLCASFTTAIYVHIINSCNSPSNVMSQQHLHNKKFSENTCPQDSNPSLLTEKSMSDNANHHSAESPPRTLGI
ncbi:hypothetical protein GOP47_0002237 [Adiantum capillus-veneris]|uniref:Uncharacterized protein n=2 Tax=Adiantum capillus-veneris TaxID=13818 RepID=A0A9D4ZP09_ADICA|nr:hypothetical protein GOP47_0002237 [Adiantum capillus-veneris]